MTAAPLALLLAALGGAPADVPLAPLVPIPRKPLVPVPPPRALPAAHPSDTRCELCHTPNGWKIWKFDHATQTEFPLRGAHADVTCESCHLEPVPDKPSLATGCNACHGAEDPHRGAFGKSCERCHSEQSWRDVHIAR